MSPTKNRISELLKVQNGFNESVIEVEAHQKTDFITDAHNKVEAMWENLEVIRNNTNRVNDILKNNVFKITKHLQDELDSLFQSTTTTSFKVNASLKEFETDLSKVEDKTGTEFRIKSIQYNSVRRAFQEVLEESSKSLEFHKTKRKDLLKKSLQTVDRNADDEALEALLEENSLDVFSDNHLQASLEARQQLKDIEDRHKELLKIEKHLNEVLDLFIKIATLVDQQQESIDRVTYHAENTTDFVERGAKSIVKTSKSHKKRRKRKTCLIVTAIIVISVVIIVLILW